MQFTLKTCLIFRLTKCKHNLCSEVSEFINDNVFVFDLSNLSKEILFLMKADILCSIESFYFVISVVDATKKGLNIVNILKYEQ